MCSQQWGQVKKCSMEGSVYRAGCEKDRGPHFVIVRLFHSLQLTERRLFWAAVLWVAVCAGGRGLLKLVNAGLRPRL